MTRFRAPVSAVSPSLPHSAFSNSLLLNVLTYKSKGTHSLGKSAKISLIVAVDLLNLRMFPRAQASPYTIMEWEGFVALPPRRNHPHQPASRKKSWFSVTM